MCLIQSHSLIHAFGEYLLCVCHELSSVLPVGVIVVSKTAVVTAFMDLYSNGKGTFNKNYTNKYIVGQIMINIKKT